MISLDQVLLLEQKVESAVAKIQQLEAENAALRKKCSELTNVLTAKSEQLNTFKADENKIEIGIKKAIERLAVIENSVLKATGSIASSTNNTPSVPVTENIPDDSEDTAEVSISETDDTSIDDQDLPEEITITNPEIAEMSIAQAMETLSSVNSKHADIPFTEDIPSSESLFDSRNSMDFNSMEPVAETKKKPVAQESILDDSYSIFSDEASEAEPESEEYISEKIGADIEADIEASFDADIDQETEAQDDLGFDIF